MSFLTRLVRGDRAEFVLGDLAEDAAARLRAGASPKAIRRWYRRQLLRSSLDLLRERLRGARGRRAGMSNARPEASMLSHDPGGGRAGASLSYTLSDACRRLQRSPGRAVAIIAIISLGVGANATTFGTLDRLFFEPPAHIRSPDLVKRLFVRLVRTSGDPGIQSTHPYADYRDWASLDVFEGVAAYSSRVLTEGSGASARRRHARDGELLSPAWRQPGGRTLLPRSG